MTNSSVFNTQAANVPSLIAGNGSSGVTVLASNPARIGFMIQNVGTTAASILIDGNQRGNSASSTVFHAVLKGGSTNNDGLGGSLTMNSGAVPTGAITMYGASTAIVTALEIAE